MLFNFLTYYYASDTDCLPLTTNTLVSGTVVNFNEFIAGNSNWISIWTGFRLTGFHFPVQPCELIREKNETWLYEM